MDNIRLITSLCLSIKIYADSVSAQTPQHVRSVRSNLLSVCACFLILVTDLKEKSLNEATCDFS